MRIEERFQYDQSLNKLSTFGIGGPVRYYLKTTQIAEIEHAIRWAANQKVPYFILGNGSNCLFDDRGFNGLMIHNKIDFCLFEDSSIYVGAGYSFAYLGVITAKKGLSGLEFASGIPATVGGAVFMNAGANGHDTSQVIEEVLFLHESGVQKKYLKQELEFGYRFSSFHSMPGSILAARFLLKKNSDAKKIQMDIIKYRRSTQPTKERSAGCVFRNPSKDLPAGALIDRCQLKGFTIGHAKISEIHANFIVNDEQATQQDVVQLIELVQKRVYEQTGVLLKTEIRLVPFE